MLQHSTEGNVHSCEKLSKEIRALENKICRVLSGHFSEEFEFMMYMKNSEISDEIDYKPIMMKVTHNQVDPIISKHIANSEVNVILSGDSFFAMCAMFNDDHRDWMIKDVVMVKQNFSIELANIATGQ